MLFSDQNSFSLEIQWYKFYCWPKSSELIGSNKTFTVHDLPSFVVIKEHVVQTQMVLLSDIFNHHKDLTSSEIGDGAIFYFARYSFAFIWNKKPIFLFDIHGCIIKGQHVWNEEAFLSDFCSIAAVNQCFVKFFKGKSKSTLQYEIWYIKTERLEFDIQVESIQRNCQLQGNL